MQKIIFESQTNYLRTFKEQYTMREIEQLFTQLAPLRVLVIGDTILDQYVFARIKGRAIKDPILSVEYKNDELYAGGILAIANHVADYVAQVTLFTIIGDKNPETEFINAALLRNVTLRAFTKKNAYTTIKKRYVDLYRNNKLFKIEYINDTPLDATLTAQVVTALHEELPKHDLVIVGDFGHGFINDAIRTMLESHAKFLAVNAQSNSANMGYNYINLYNKPGFMTMNEDELRMPLSRRFEELEQVILETRKKFKFDKFLVTQGKQGCTYVNEDKLFIAPALTNHVTDTVGAGDALFALASLTVYAKVDDELVPFLANCAGAIASNIIGNKESVRKEKLIAFIRDLLK